MSGMSEVLEHDNPGLDLSDAFTQDAGYHGTCWVDIGEGGELSIDREIPVPLRRFLGEVATIVNGNEAIASLGRTGCAYMRIIDGGKPENYMAWHTDNPDGGVRFHTAIATDDARVNLAWPNDPALLEQAVEETDWEAAHKPDNGVIVAFTTQLHGVTPQPVRPGEKTAIFFATLYGSREEADLYTTNNTTTSQHATLPILEEG